MKKSIEEFELALEIDPHNYWAALGAGNLCLYELNDLERAKHYLLRAAQIKPEEWFTYFSLGDLFCRLGDFQAADLAYERGRCLKDRDCSKEKENPFLPREGPEPQ